MLDLYLKGELHQHHRGIGSTSSIKATLLDLIHEAEYLLERYFPLEQSRLELVEEVKDYPSTYITEIEIIFDQLNDAVESAWLRDSDSDRLQFHSTFTKEAEGIDIPLPTEVLAFAIVSCLRMLESNSQDTSELTNIARLIPIARAIQSNFAIKIHCEDLYAANNSGQKTKQKQAEDLINEYSNHINQYLRETDFSDLSLDTIAEDLWIKIDNALIKDDRAQPIKDFWNSFGSTAMKQWAAKNLAD